MPCVGSPSPVIAFSARISLATFEVFINAIGSLTFTPTVPRTTMALRFFDPITAPTPDRPAARSISFTTAAYRTPFSPARPIEATRTSLSPRRSRKVVSVSHTDLPHRSDASLSSASSLVMSRYTGVSDLPSKIIISHPAFFNSPPKNPPELEQAMAPVSGLLQTTDQRPDVGAMVPVSGPVAIIILLSGENGSTLGSVSSTRYLVAKPRWPM